VLKAKFVVNMYVLDITNKVVISNYSKVNLQSYILYNNYNNSTLSKVKLYYKQFGHKNLSTIYKLLIIKPSSNYRLDCVACIKAKAINIILREIAIEPKQ
jgi:hypothetical protein